MTTAESDNSKYLAYGYIKMLKTTNDLNNEMNVPMPIKNLCALFIGPVKKMDFFEIAGNDNQIRSKSTIGDKSIIESKGKWGTAYGIIVIDPSLNKQYIWQFHIAQRTNGSVVIGIDQFDSNMENKDFSGNIKSKNYSYCGGNGRKYPGGIPFNDTLGIGDTVYMKLDFTSSKQTAKGKLLYKISKNYRRRNSCSRDDQYKIAFDDVNIDTKYKLAVAIDKRWTVELIDYTESWS